MRMGEVLLVDPAELGQLARVLSTHLSEVQAAMGSFASHQLAPGAYGNLPAAQQAGAEFARLTDDMQIQLRRSGRHLQDLCRGLADNATIFTAAEQEALRAVDRLSPGA
jgi:hypothetical protein